MILFCTSTTTTLTTCMCSAENEKADTSLFCYKIHYFDMYSPYFCAGLGVHYFIHPFIIFPFIQICTYSWASEVCWQSQLISLLELPSLHLFYSLQPLVPGLKEMLKSTKFNYPLLRFENWTHIFQYLTQRLLQSRTVSLQRSYNLTCQ